MLFSPHHFAAPVSLCCLTKLAVFSLSLHSEKDQTPYESQARDLNVAFHTANTLCVLVIPFTSVSPSSSCDVARLNYFPLCAIAVQPVWPRLLVCSFFSFPILFLSLSLPSTYISQPLLLRLYFCFTSHDIPPPSLAKQPPLFSRLLSSSLTASCFASIHHSVWGWCHMKIWRAQIQMRAKVAVFVGGGGKLFNKRLCFWESKGGECCLPSSLPPPPSRSLSTLSLCTSVYWCVRLPSLPAPLLFAATTDELGRGGKADVSGHRKAGVWIGIRD